MFIARLKLRMKSKATAQFTRDYANAGDKHRMTAIAHACQGIGEARANQVDKHFDVVKTLTLAGALLSGVAKDSIGDAPTEERKRPPKTGLAHILDQRYVLETVYPKPADVRRRLLPLMLNRAHTLRPEPRAPTPCQVPCRPVHALTPKTRLATVRLVSGQDARIPYSGAHVETMAPRRHVGRCRRQAGRRS